MRRLLAIVLTMLVSFPLIAAAFVSKGEDKLPACCRRDGKHGCGMAKMKVVSDSSQPSFQSVKGKCPLYPSTYSAPASTQYGTEASNAQLIFAAVVSHPTVQPQTLAQLRISFSRAWQKRGPPVSQS